ncbi:MAG TPA: septal ring lytic transglycosylase RlpA family protein [Candidatus Gastranaerophilales bacterium]|nr:septal ring lytic transglycosylase RlpA family protein [Candidatus Gastranaerophilales bacterium]
MNLKRFTGFISVFLITCLFWTSYSAFAQKSVAEEKQILAVTENDLQQETEIVYYKLHEMDHGKSIPATVYINRQEIITLDQIAGGLTPRERAAIFVKTLRAFLEQGQNPQKIFPDFEKGIAVIKHEDKILFTADAKSAKSQGINANELAFLWANSVRKALGASELIKDYELFKNLVENYVESAGFNETGMASWYGGDFHGRSSADGSIYDKNQFTAAHKSLPFGSVVKVTNLRNGNACLVKITDRGPFVQGRIIDLSRVAAKEIGMLSSGVSKVTIEVLGKV